MIKKMMSILEGRVVQCGALLDLIPHQTQCSPTQAKTKNSLMQFYQRICDENTMTTQIPNSFTQFYSFCTNRPRLLHILSHWHRLCQPVNKSEANERRMRQTRCAMPSETLKHVVNNNTTVIGHSAPHLQFITSCVCSPSASASP